MDSILSDLRYAARKLALTPGFTIVAILTLGLAIGATTTVYSVVDAVLIRPLPFTHPAQLVRVESTAHDGQISDASALDLNDYRAQSRTLAGLVPVKAVSSISVQRDAGATLHLTWARVGAASSHSLASSRSSAAPSPAGRMHPAARRSRSSYAAVVAVLFAVALLASLLPARRAARLDPAIAMRVS